MNSEANARRINFVEECFGNSGQVITSKLFSQRDFVALLPPATKLGQGYIFTGVYDSVHRGGVPPPEGAGASSQGGVCSRGGPGGDPPGTATAAGGKHPTGMHSWFIYYFRNKNGLHLFILKIFSGNCTALGYGTSSLSWRRSID